VQYDDGEEDADLVVGAFGVNSPLIPQLTKNLGYIPPETVKVAQTEVAMDNDYIDGFYGNRILAFAIKDPKIRFLAVTPKKNYLTLTAVGNDISLKDLRAYIKRNRVLRFINEDYSGELVGCHCHPRMPIGMAKGAVSDRFVVVGDAFASRFYKNGLGSAHYTAIKAAEAIIQNGYKKKYLAPVYGRAIRKRFGWSNRWGKLLFYINDFTYKTPWMARATIDYVQRERERMDVGPVNALMWSLFTGDRSYSRLVRKAFNPFLLLRMFIWYIRYAILGIGRWMTSTIKAR
jgi:flavin-dependent dehydrogenase